MKTNLSKVLALLLALSMSLVFLTACGGDPPPMTPGASTPDGSSQPAGEPGAAKDSVTLATSAEPVRFFASGPDGSNNNDLPMLNNCYDPLVYLLPDGSLIPCLAEEWDVSEDGLVYTFKLRSGVKFHDGSEMTADDVAFSYDLTSQNSVGKALLINYDHAVVVDPTTVEIHLSAPYAAFLKGAASRAGYIISKAHYEAVGADGYLKEPIGTGAYKFVSAVSGDTVTLEAFPDYWKGEAPIKNIYIKTMTDPSTQMIALENGDVDAIHSPTIASCINLDESRGTKWITGNSAGRVTLHISSNAGTPGADTNFRKAVQAAVNKEDVIMGATEGYATRLEIDIPENYSGYPTGYDVVAQDVEKAKEYLSQSAYNGEEFEILVQAGTTFDTVAQIIQAQLMEVGINCKVNAVDTATFTDMWYGGNYGGMIRSTSSSLLDADGFLNFFMASEANYAPTVNNQHAKTKEIYDMGMEARTLADEGARKELYLKCVNIVTEEAYEVPLYVDVNVMAFRSDLKGVEVHPLTLLTFYNWSWE